MKDKKKKFDRTLQIDTYYKDGDPIERIRDLLHHLDELHYANFTHDPVVQMIVAELQTLRVLDNTGEWRDTPLGHFCADFYADLAFERQKRERRTRNSGSKDY
jgi:hypothetical protein